MTTHRKNLIMKQEKDLLSFSAFKEGQSIAEALVNLEFCDKAALKIKNLNELFLTKENSKRSTCKCINPTKKEIENALKKYNVAKQKELEIKQKRMNLKHAQVVKESPELPGNITFGKEMDQNTTEKVKPEVQMPNQGFTSAREECLRQASVKNRAPPAGVSSKPPPKNQSVRRYMGNRLVTVKPVTKNSEADISKKMMEDSEQCEDERLRGIDKELLERLKIDVIVKPSGLSMY